MSMGFIDLSEGEGWFPGETRELEITLSTWPELDAVLAVGRTWILREGAKITGDGEILVLLD